jgi:hypothetical protein
VSGRFLPFLEQADFCSVHGQLPCDHTADNSRTDNDKIVDHEKPPLFIKQKHQRTPRLRLFGASPDLHAKIFLCYLLLYTFKSNMTTVLFYFFKEGNEKAL